jgi:hypothetical protein
MHVIHKKKGHNMLALMLDHGYKNMCLITSYLGHEVATNLVVNYNEKLLLPLLLEAYKVLMHNKINYIDDEFDSLVDSLDLFQQTNDTNANTYNNIVTKELGAQRYKCVFNMVANKRIKFPHYCSTCLTHLGNLN